MLVKVSNSKQQRSAKTRSFPRVVTSGRTQDSAGDKLSVQARVFPCEGLLRVVIKAPEKLKTGVQPKFNVRNSLFELVKVRGEGFIFTYRVYIT